MKKIDLRIDVSKAAGLDGPQQIAASVFLPEPNTLRSPAVVLFAAPGGGYTRGYYDLSFPGHAGYSQAEQHTARGFIVVAYDHLGVGESTTTGLARLNFENLAAANDAAVREIHRRLVAGEVDASLPALPELVKIGIGQSMGGCLAVVAQGRHRSFDAIAVLGFSAIHTVLPQRAGIAQAVPAPQRGSDASALSIDTVSRSVPDFVYPFFWEDTPRDILDADLAGGYPLRRSAPAWGSLSIPACAVMMISPGCIAREAAAIEVPLLLAMGERDVCPRPHAEPGAYPACRDISLYVVPQMAHMHNFASTRQGLWNRIECWAQRVAGSR
jgi:alpha-beta hydrolase superfamily lysophospholipase